MLEQALPPIEKLINRALQLDPEFLPKLSKVEGKLLHIYLLQLEADIFVMLTQQGVQLLTKPVLDVAPDLIISATPLALLRYISVAKDYAHPADHQVNIQGDVGLAQQLQQLAKSLDIDWEGQLAKITGDLVAHRLGRFAKGVKTWAKQASKNMQQDVSEYLQYEVELLPTREQIENFYSDVDTLRDDSERLLMKFKQLRQQAELTL
jgi:ubiquinone biosynthesis accessory factor UbiJ